MKILVKVVVGAVIFCIVLASVLIGWALWQRHNDYALLKDYAANTLGLDVDKSEQSSAFCRIDAKDGRCSALQFKVKNSTCIRVISKIQSTSMGCKEVQDNFKGRVLQIRPTGYSDKPGLYLEVVLMERHAILNII